MIVIGLTAFRYRKQIQSALYVWRMFRKMRQMGKPQEGKRIEKTENSSTSKLVKCAKCGTWTPLTKAIYFRSKIFYCSKNCLESIAVN